MGENKNNNALNRFLKYISYNTQSNEESNTFPSTKGQWDLLHLLHDELIAMGLRDVRIDNNYGYVYAVIPSNYLEKATYSIGFIAHVDTSDAISGENIRARIINNYDGGDIVLKSADERSGQIVTEIKDFPELKNYIGKSLVVTDGTTLLGADDKAGVTVIMEMAAYFCEHPEVKHGNICIAFTPDEEIGKGVDYFDIQGFGADYAYTVDGGALGELSYENFNAANAEVIFHGRSVHPGDAKGKMRNAILMMQEFESLLPKKEKPEYTELREGFYHLTNVAGNCEQASSEYIIREHDMEMFEMRKAYFNDCGEKMNSKYGAGSVQIEMEDSYYNMESIVRRHRVVTDVVKKAMAQLDIPVLDTPIRGGTDGARLSFLGLPCPNLGTGGGNFHGKHEYLCIEDLNKNVELLIQIVKEYAAL